MIFEQFNKLLGEIETRDQHLLRQHNDLGTPWPSGRRSSSPRLDRDGGEASPRANSSPT